MLGIEGAHAVVFVHVQLHVLVARGVQDRDRQDPLAGEAGQRLVLQAGAMGGVVEGMEEATLAVDHQAHDQRAQQALQPQWLLRGEQLLAVDHREEEHRVAPTDVQVELPGLEQGVFRPSRRAVVQRLAGDPGPERLAGQVLVGTAHVDAVSVLGVSGLEQFILHGAGAPSLQVVGSDVERRDGREERVERLHPVVIDGQHDEVVEALAEEFSHQCVLGGLGDEAGPDLLA